MQKQKLSKKLSTEDKIWRAKIEKIMTQKYRRSFLSGFADALSVFVCLLFILAVIFFVIVAIAYFGTLLLENPESLAILFLSIFVLVLIGLIWKKEKCKYCECSEAYCCSACKKFYKEGEYGDKKRTKS